MKKVAITVTGGALVCLGIYLTFWSADWTTRLIGFVLVWVGATLSRQQVTDEKTVRWRFNQSIAKQLGGAILLIVAVYLLGRLGQDDYFGYLDDHYLAFTAIVILVGIIAAILGYSAVDEAMDRGDDGHPSSEAD